MKAHRALLVTVALVASLLVGLLVAPTSARAASVVWVPPSWVTSAAGSASDGRTALGGGGTSVTGGPAWTYGTPPALSGGQFGRALLKITGTETLTWSLVQCFPGTISSSFCYPNTSPADGSLVTIQGVYFALECGDGTIYSAAANTVAAGVIQASVCGGHGAPKRGFTTGTGTTAMTFYPGSLALGVSESFTTELTCRDSDGQDQVVSETSTGVSPSPVCPAGTVAVRVKISSSTRGVIQDTSMSADWQAWADYVRGGGGFALPGVGGVPCLIGMVCSIDPWWQSPATPPSNADCWLIGHNGSQMSLTPADCQTAQDEGAVQQEEGTDEQANGTDLNPLMRLLEGLTSGLRKAIDAVKSAIDGVKSTINNVVTGIQNSIKSITDVIVNAINAVKDAINSGFQRLSDLLHELFDGDGGGAGGSTGPPHGVPSNAGGLADKFSPWTNLLGGLSAGLSDSGTCEGPPLTLNFGSQSYTVHLFNACGERATLAFWSRTFITLGLIITVIMSTIRVFSSAIGLQLRGGD